MRLEWRPRRLAELKVSLERAGAKSDSMVGLKGANSANRASFMARRVDPVCPLVSATKLAVAPSIDTFHANQSVAFQRHSGRPKIRCVA